MKGPHDNVDPKFHPFGVQFGFGPSWFPVGTHLGPFGDSFGPVWGPFGIHSGPFGCHLGSLLFRAHLNPFGAHFYLFGTHLGGALALLGPTGLF